MSTRVAFLGFNSLVINPLAHYHMGFNLHYLGMSVYIFADLVQSPHRGSLDEYQQVHVTGDPVTGDDLRNRMKHMYYIAAAGAFVLNFKVGTDGFFLGFTEQQLVTTDHTVLLELLDPV